jgi:hypothetical protein
MPPSPTVDSVEAAVRIAPRVGPVQGSQATAKARPATIGPPVCARRISCSGRHSRFRSGMNSVAMKRTPISAITIPEISRRTWRWSLSVWPRPVALMPSATNIAVKARQKRRAGPSTFLVPRPSWMSANETPEIVER